MSMNRAVMIFLLTGLAATASAQQWHLVQCSAAEAGARAEFRNALQRIPAGKLNHISHPFPQADAHVFANFKQQFLEASDKLDYEKMPADRQRLVRNLKMDNVVYQVERVANWRMMRCNQPQAGDAMSLVVMKNKITGAELGRAALQQSGQLEQTLFAEKPLAPAEAAQYAVPDPAAVLADVQKRTGIKGEAPQLVTTTGALRCDVLFPCVAFRDGGAAYIVSGEGELFAVADGARRFSHRRELSSYELREQNTRFLRADEKVVSLGGDVYAVARKH